MIHLCSGRCAGLPGTQALQPSQTQGVAHQQAGIGQSKNGKLCRPKTRSLSVSRQASFILTVQALRKRTESTSNLIQSIEDEQTRLEQVNAILVADEETEEYQIKVRGLIRVAM